jgi:hypothetical protein
MHLDRDAFARTRTRFRAENYPRVAVIIRQTARFPIAAVHAPPLAFRNSLLAAYTDEPHTLVALLNSTLLRTAHLASQRDGRQAIFPQLKIAHLRALPAPPAEADLSPLDALAREAQSAEQARHEAMERVRTASAPVPVPRAVFASDPAVRDAAWRKSIAAHRGDRRAFAEQLARSADEIAAAAARLARATRAIDAVVFSAYGVDPGAFDVAPEKA